MPQVNSALPHGLFICGGANESVCLKIDCFFYSKKWFKKKCAASRGREKIEAAENIFAACKLYKTSRRPRALAAGQMFCTAYRPPFFSNKMRVILEPGTHRWAAVVQCCFCGELVALPMTDKTHHQASISTML